MTPLVYIAGPFRATSPWLVEQNVRRAEEWALAVACAGGMPVTPHLLGRHFNDHPIGRPDDEQFWLAGTLELMRRCDGVLMIPKWSESRGATAELDEAGRIGLPVLFADHVPVLLGDWIAGLGEASLVGGRR